MTVDITSSNQLLAQQRETAKRLEKERKEQQAIEYDLDSLLESVGLEQHAELLSTKSSLNDLASRLVVNRPLFLEYIKHLGVKALGDRQKLSNALAKAQRAGQISPPSLTFPQLVPVVFDEDDEKLTVRLKLPPGTATTQVKVKFEVMSLEVHYCGAPTAASGKLMHSVRVSECMWEIERARRPEYDPMLDASEQPPAGDDTLVISLAKTDGGTHRWKHLFTDTNATRVVAAPKAEDAKVTALKAARQKHIENRKHEMLYGKDITPLPPKDPELKKVEERERIERLRRREKRFESGQSGTPTTSAREHYQPAKAVLLWRQGLERSDGETEHPADCPPMYTWEETAEQIIVRAPTSKGLAPSDLKLEVGTNFVDAYVKGVQTPWTGVLVGKVDPAQCRLEVLPASPPPAAAGEDEKRMAGVSATLTLTLAKADASRTLWRAPWPELLASIELRERRLAKMGEVARRDFLQVGGFDEVQEESTWTIVIPYRADNGKWLKHDDLRIGVSAETLNVHIVGQEDAPILGGELAGKIVPMKCSWRVREAKNVGSMKVEEIELTLAKENRAMWKQLLRKAYS